MGLHTFSKKSEFKDCGYKKKKLEFSKKTLFCFALNYFIILMLKNIIFNKFLNKKYFKK